MSRGGFRANSGRKPKVEEHKLIEQMDKVGAPNKALEILWELVEKRDFHALKLWLAYRLGQPKQIKDQPTELIQEYKPPIIKMVLPLNAKSLLEDS